MREEEVATDYLNRIFDPDEFGQTIFKTLKVARRVMEQNPFDSIAFTGVSGSAMAFIMAAELKVSLLCVRKYGEGSHYSRTCGLLEGYMGAKRYLFVDDFISSGDTYRRVYQLLKEKLPTAECVGALTYTSYSRESFCPSNRTNIGDKLPVYSVPEYENNPGQICLPGMDF